MTGLDCVITSSIDEVKESAGETLGRLLKGEIKDEELKKLVKIRFDKRLQWGYKSSHQEQLSFNLEFIKSLKKMDMSGEVETINKETYELPTEFLEAAFGKSMKSRGCYFKHESATIQEAEDASHELYCERALIKNGQTVLDIGCGQGGLVLYIAQKYKNCQVTGLTNSKAQVNYLLNRAEKLGLTNVHAILADVTQYELGTYDRLLMIKLIEHMKNIQLFMKKLSTWMTEDSLLFVEHVCHKTFSHFFKEIDEDDWYSGFIFPKGPVTILSANSLLYFQDDVSVVDHWVVNGMHMARSFDAWRKKLEENTEVANEILLHGLGGSHEALNGVVTRIRTFFMGGYEQFSLNNGEEWMVAHLLFKKCNEARL